MAAGSRRARPPGRAALAATAGPQPLPLASPPLRLLTLQRRLLRLSRARRGGGGPAGRGGGARGGAAGLPAPCRPRRPPAARLPRRHATAAGGRQRRAAGRPGAGCGVVARGRAAAEAGRGRGAARGGARAHSWGSRRLRVLRPGIPARRGPRSELPTWLHLLRAIRRGTGVGKR